jgi:single-strand DNA-binding protein
MTNTVVILGRLTKAPEVRYGAESQKAVARFTIANDDGWGENKRTNFVPVVAFGKLAENCERFLDKGRMVAVTGKLVTGSYTNKDGVKVYTTDVFANDVQFIGSGNKDGQNANQGATGGNMDVPEGFAAIDDSSIPF